MSNLVEEFIKKCQEDKDVVYGSTQKFSIGKKTYNGHSFGTKLSERGIDSFVKAVESIDKD